MPTTQASSTAQFSFMKFRYLFFAISLFFLIPGVASLALYRLKPAIDFTGGSLLEISIEPKEGVQFESAQPKIQEVVGESYELSSVQQSGERQLILRGKDITNQQKLEAISKLQAAFGKVEERRFETVGPVLGRELIQKTLVAVAVVSTVITLYVWHQFHNLKYGVSAILAMFHDSLILLGAFSVLGKFYNIEVDVLFVTALLTTLSFSIHDTIVVFDRIREMMRKNPRVPFITIVDAAVLETLGRSLNNSMTIIIMLAALVLLGGETTKWFAVALLVGAVTGTYSSTFTAAPLLILWDEVQLKFKKRV